MKKFKTKKKYRLKKKVKITLYILLIIFSINVTINYLVSTKINFSNEEFVRIMLNEGNKNIVYDYNPFKLFNKVSDVLFNIDFTDPFSIFASTTIHKVYKDDLDSGIIVNMEYTDDYNLDELSDKSEYVSDPSNTTIDNPRVYIYNTHQLENYSTVGLEAQNISPNVMMASYFLKDNLNSLSVPTIVEESNIADLLNLYNYSYNKSYKVTEKLINEIKLAKPTLEYFIDIHRDSIKYDSSTMTIGDKNYAKILFVVGLEHENYQYNLDLAKKLHGILEETYPGLSRGIITKQGANVDGIYNQNLSKNAMLLEVGGVDNSIEEVKNTMDAFSVAFKKMLEE